jgi:hypothetical protein
MSVHTDEQPTSSQLKISGGARLVQGQGDQRQYLRMTWPFALFTVSDDGIKLRIRTPIARFMLRKWAKGVTTQNLDSDGTFLWPWASIASASIGKGEVLFRGPDKQFLFIIFSTKDTDIGKLTSICKTHGIAIDDDFPSNFKLLTGVT